MDKLPELEDTIVTHARPKTGFRAASFTPTANRTPVVYGKTSEAKKATGRRGKMKSPRGR